MSKTFRRSDGYKKYDWRNKKAKKHFKKLEKNKFKKNTLQKDPIDEDYQVYSKELERF